MKDAGAGARSQARSDSRPNINVTPLIDILLVLLIIFMVVTPLRPARFKALVPAPPEESEIVKKSPRTLVVEVEGAGSLRLVRGMTTVAEASVEDPSAVSERLAREWRERIKVGGWKEGFEARADLAPDQRIERTVFVRAPRAIPYGRVARVIDALKGAGANPVGLQTDALPN
jgi:biopolymer transport protein ExbD